MSNFVWFELELNLIAANLVMTHRTRKAKFRMNVIKKIKKKITSGLVSLKKKQAVRYINIITCSISN